MAAQTEAIPLGENPSYYRARYYDELSARFLREDSVRFDSDVNFYRYVLNNPVNHTDPLGLASQGWHYDTTYNLAKKIFGPKCEDKAREVAAANAAMDDHVNYVAKARFLTFQGSDWDSPGPHFPSPDFVAGGLSNAVKTCNLPDLGRGVHSLQDMYFHFGITPGWHFVFFGWDWAVQDLNAISPVPRVSAATDGTASWLKAFKDNCLQCCN
ncbi:MAG TPA: RHS repeat-associated core domain-containing protein [Blastocatellia bacterium]|nr:RHS repeat-associated core domain-containing protein [Blastocatellia bacterium]